LSISSHLPASEYSNAVNPVALPPGRAKLATAPVPTGSLRLVNTIGMVRVSASRASTPGVLPANSTSGFASTKSLAMTRMRAGSPAGQR